MPRQTSTLTIAGKLDGKIYYHSFGKDLVRSAPRKVRISENSRKANTEFLRASATAALVRRHLYFMVRPIADSRFSLRLTSYFTRIIASAYNRPKGERRVADGDLSLLRGFPFNQYKSDYQVCKIRPVVDIKPGQGVSIHIPAFSFTESLSLAPNASVLVMQLSCSYFDLSNDGGTVAQGDEIHINLGQERFPGGEAFFPPEEMDNKVVLAAIGFYFLDKEGQPIANRDHRAGSILEAVLVTDGQVQSFRYPEKKSAEEMRLGTKGGMGWKLYKD
jgi:hypothetical protein